MVSGQDRAKERKDNQEGRMRILVTGGAGFIGKYVFDRLAKTTHSVAMIDKRISSAQDIRNIDFELGYDVVIHLAALRSVQDSMANPAEYFSNNVFGTYNVMRHNKNARIINISSCAAHGPESPYGFSKLMTEYIAEHFDNVMTLRLHNVFGPGDEDGGLLIPYIANQMLHKLPIHLHGDGSQVRDYIYIDDVVDEILHFAMSDDVGIKEVGYGKGRTVKEVICEISKLMDSNTAVVCSKKRPGDQQFAESKDKLAIKNPVGFKEGLKRTVDYYDKIFFSA